MPQYDDSMRGVLFRNDKRTTEKHPDYKGNGEVNGIAIWISAWLKTSKDGTKKFLSLSFENKEGQQVGTQDVPIQTAGLEPVPVTAADPDLDDIPF